MGNTLIPTQGPITTSTQGSITTSTQGSITTPTQGSITTATQGSITFKVTDVIPKQVHTYPFDWKTILPNKNDVNNELVRSSHIGELDFSNGTNSFVMSAFKAYSQHHNLVIKPDDVWLAICAQFSNYVNGNSEALRKKIVDFNGKKELVVYGNGNLFTADYEELCAKMTDEISKNIKDPSVREWVIPNFTTTTETEKMVGAVTLMATMKHYFDYKICLLCNLPSVTLLGEVQDWVNVRERANKLLEFDLQQGHMSAWSQLLFPILDKFVESAQGNPDVKWWNRIANEEGGGSGPSYLSGWITTFCVFSEDGTWNGDKKQLKNWDRTKTLKTSEWPIIDIKDIPRGYVNVPITIDDNVIFYKTEMFAGHVKATKGQDGVTVSPSVGWALFTVN